MIKSNRSVILIAGLSLVGGILAAMQAPHVCLSDFYQNAYGASVIPITTRSNGERYTLLAREAWGADQDTYDAFGGGKEAGETHPSITAARELAEETVGILGDKHYLQKYLNIDNGNSKHIIANMTKKFVVFITQFPKSTLDSLMEDFHKERNKSHKNCCKEKDKLAWVKYSDLQNAIAFAPRYKNGKLIQPITVHALVHEKTGEKEENINLRPILVSSLQSFFKGEAPVQTGFDPRIVYYN